MFGCISSCAVDLLIIVVGRNEKYPCILVIDISSMTKSDCFVKAGMVWDIAIVN